MKNIVKIKYDSSYYTYENGFRYKNGRIGGDSQYVFKSEINYIKGKPFWKGKEIYEIIEEC